MTTVSKKYEPIAERCGVEPRTVYNFFRKHHIDLEEALDQQMFLMCVENQIKGTPLIAAKIICDEVYRVSAKQFKTEAKVSELEESVENLQSRVHDLENTIARMDKENKQFRKSVEGLTNWGKAASKHLRKQTLDTRSVEEAKGYLAQNLNDPKQVNKARKCVEDYGTVSKLLADYSLIGIEDSDNIEWT